MVGDENLDNAELACNEIIQHFLQRLCISKPESV